MQLQNRAYMVPKVDALFIISLKGQCVTATWVLVTVMLLFSSPSMTAIPFCFMVCFGWVLFKPVRTQKEDFCNYLVSSKYRPVSLSLPGIVPFSHCCFNILKATLKKI